MQHQFIPEVILEDAAWCESASCLLLRGTCNSVVTARYHLRVHENIIMVCQACDTDGIMAALDEGNKFYGMSKSVLEECSEWAHCVFRFI